MSAPCMHVITVGFLASVTNTEESIDKRAVELAIRRQRIWKKR